MKKFFITLMCIVMMVCFMPTVAFADEGEVVAKIGDNEYTSLAEAVSKVPKDGTPTTIVLQKTTSGCGVVVESGQNIIFDLSGYSYTVTDPLVGSSGTETNGFQLLKGSTVKFQNGTVKAGSSARILFQNYCNLTLENVTADASESEYCEYVVSNNHGQVLFTGNTNIKAAENNCAFDVYYWPDGGYGDGVSVTVNTTGTIKGKIEYGSDGTENGKSEIAKNATLLINGGTIEGEISAYGLNTSCETGISITGGTFSDLSALNYVVDGAKIKLSKDATISSEIHVDKELTIDLNGYNITSSGSYALSVIAGGKLTLEGSGKVSARYCALALTGSDTDDGSKCVANIGENVTLSAPYYGAIIWQKNVDEKTGTASYGVELNLDGKIEGTDTDSAGIFVLGNIKATEGNVPVLNLGPNASVKGRVAVALNGYGQLNVNGATVEGTDTGIEVRAGKLNVNSGTITGKGIPTNVQPNGSGTTTSGAGIGVAQHTTKLPINVIIKGGTIEGYSALYQSNPEKNPTDDVAKVSLQVLGGNLNAINKGPKAVYSENKTGFITGGTFSSDPTAYVPANSNYRVRTNSNGTYTVYHYTPYVPSIPTDSLKTARTEAIKAVTDYVNPADYEEAQQAEIKTIVDNAKKDIEAAKTADEIKAIEAAAKAELDKLETAEEMSLIRAIGETKFVARSKAVTLKNGKKAIKITWYDKNGKEVKFDGVEIFRSTKRYSGYGKEAIYVSKSGVYYNTAIEAGTKYYYKVRGYVLVNGEKVYTDYSTKAWRTA